MEEQMVTISAFKDREEALISKALLEAAGVPVTLKDDLGELQLQVRDTDAQLAQEVLVAAESPGWRRRTSRRHSRRFRSRTNRRVAACFFRGGGICVSLSLVFLLLLLVLGIRINPSPFPLFFVFVVGGCGWVVRHFFRVRQRRFRTRIQ